MEIEFDTVARWTRDVVERLGPEYAIPAGCRGSAGPAGLDRLCDDLRPGMRLADLGGGVGGPAAYAREQAGIVPVVVDPMPGACRAASRLFGVRRRRGRGAGAARDRCGRRVLVHRGAVHRRGQGRCRPGTRRVLIPADRSGYWCSPRTSRARPDAAGRQPVRRWTHRTLLREGGFDIEDTVALGELRTRRGHGRSGPTGSNDTLTREPRRRPAVRRGRGPERADGRPDVRRRRPRPSPARPLTRPPVRPAVRPLRAGAGVDARDVLGSHAVAAFAVPSRGIPLAIARGPPGAMSRPGAPPCGGGEVSSPIRAPVSHAGVSFGRTVEPCTADATVYVE